MQLYVGEGVWGMGGLLHFRQKKKNVLTGSENISKIFSVDWKKLKKNEGSKKVKIQIVKISLKIKQKLLEANKTFWVGS